MSSFVLDGNDESIGKFSADEITAAKETRKILIEVHKMTAQQLSDREILIVTMNCKLRPDTAAAKYKKFLESMKVFGIESFDEVWSGVKVNGRDGENDENEWDKLSTFFQVYAGCGRDKMGRSIMWINTRPVEVEEETSAIRSSVIYYTAIHADLVSLRNGTYNVR